MHLYDLRGHRHLTEPVVKTDPLFSMFYHSRYFHFYFIAGDILIRAREQMPPQL